MHACMLSHFSHVWLYVTLWTAAHQAPLSTGFSRQEYWSGLPFPSPLYSSVCNQINLKHWGMTYLRKDTFWDWYSPSHSHTHTCASMHTHTHISPSVSGCLWGNILSVALSLIIKIKTSGFSKRGYFAPKMFSTCCWGHPFCGCSLSLDSQCSALPRNY